MAKTRAAPPPAPTPDRVTRLARAGDPVAAVELARRLHDLTPTADNLALLRRTVFDAAVAFADRDRDADFARVMAAADRLGPADRACLLARGGRLPEALMVAPDEARPRVLGHAADRAVRVRSKEPLPDDFHPGFDAVLLAFRHHEAGEPDAARAALEPVGLRSPFLEWKVLLRGLLAHAAGDDARAAEAFARLDPSRLPARLAAPLRAGLDPAFRAAGEPGLLDRCADLTRHPAVDKLRAVGKELGSDKPLGPAFKAAEAALPHLKRVAPDLLPRLAAAFYHALAGRGEPDDLPRYKKLFGEPPDDPQFHKLLALIAEQVGDPAGVHAHWLRYDAWLAANPPGWPADLLARARAEVWDRLGENARKAAGGADEPDPLLGFFAPPRRRKPKPPDPPADECFRRAADLAPDWPDPGRKRFEALAAAGRAADAEAAARAVLARRPDDLTTLVALAELVQRQGRASDAADLWLKALAVHPLDPAVRFRAATAVLAEARRQAAETKKAAEAVTAPLDRHRSLLEEQTPSALHALRSVILTKQGQPDDAAAERAKALAVPGGRVGAAYRVMADSLLLRVKPADKKAADALFAGELAKPPTPWEVNQLIAAYDAYHVDGVTFRGQKGHDKKVLDQVARCQDAAAPPEEFDRLLALLLFKQEWRHAKKLADALIVRFPDDPAFHVGRAEAGLGLDERAFHVENRLRRAKGLAERSADPRHRAVLGRIEKLLKEIAPPLDLFEAFFGR